MKVPITQSDTGHDSQVNVPSRPRSRRPTNEDLFDFAMPSAPQRNGNETKHPSFLRPSCLPCTDEDRPSTQLYCDFAAPSGCRRSAPPTPSEERDPAWRWPCLAYDEWRQAGADDHEAHEAAVAAVQTVLALPWQ